MNMKPLTVPDRRISRRTFVLGGSALAASAWLLGPNRISLLPNGLMHLAAGSARRLSVGYVEASAGATPAEIQERLTTGSARIVPAASLRSGERSLVGREARVRIYGPAPGSWANVDPDLSAVEFDVLINSPDRRTPETVLPFFAWTEVFGPPAKSSSPTSFVVPVEREASLGFAIRVKRHTDSPTADAVDHVAVLSGGRESGTAKIRQGAYLVAPDPAAWSRPRVLGPGHDVSAVLASFLISVERSR